MAILSTPYATFTIEPLINGKNHWLDVYICLELHFNDSSLKIEHTDKNQVSSIMHEELTRFIEQNRAFIQNIPNLDFSEFLSSHHYRFSPVEGDFGWDLCIMSYNPDVDLADHSVTIDLQLEVMYMSAPGNPDFLKPYGNFKVSTPTTIEDVLVFLGKLERELQQIDIRQNLTLIKHSEL